MKKDVIDQNVYDGLKEAAGAEFVVELVDAFLEEAPGMFADLRTALDDGDADGFRRAAHSLKSNADVFGALALAASARALELMEVSGATPEIQILMAQLETELSCAIAALTGIENE